MKIVPKQRTVQLHASKQQIGQFIVQIEEIAGRLLTPQANLLLRHPSPTEACHRANSRSQQLNEAKHLLYQAKTILENLR